MTGVVGSDRAAVKPRLAVLAWAVAAVSVAGFTPAWVLAARSRDLLGLSANFGPDRFLVAYAVVGGVVASRRSSKPHRLGLARHWPGDGVPGAGRGRPRSL